MKKITAKHPTGRSATIVVDSAVLNFTDGRLMSDMIGKCGKKSLRGTITSLDGKSFYWQLHTHAPVESGVAVSMELAKRRMAAVAGTLNP